MRRFVNVPISSLSDLKGEEFRVYAFLQLKWQEGPCFPAWFEISEALGLTRSSVYRVIRKLKKKGLVETGRVCQYTVYELVEANEWIKKNITK